MTISLLEIKSDEHGVELVTTEGTISLPLDRAWFFLKQLNHSIEYASKCEQCAGRSDRDENHKHLQINDFFNRTGKGDARD